MGRTVPAGECLAMILCWRVFAEGPVQRGWGLEWEDHLQLDFQQQKQRSPSNLSVIKPKELDSQYSYLGICVSKTSTQKQNTFAINFTGSRVRGEGREEIN